MTSQAVFSAELIKGPEDLEEVFSDSFYESPISAPMPKVEIKEGSTVPPVKGMPVFKKVRIKITNKLDDGVDIIECAYRLQAAERKIDVKVRNMGY